MVGKKINCPYCSAPNTISGETESAKPKDPLVDQVVRGCRLEKRLGAGAFGAVYSATYMKGNRPVAIKLLSTKAASKPDLVQRFDREARLSCEVEHPGIVKGFDYGEERGAHFLVMEFVDGTSWAAMIADKGHLKWKESAKIGRPSLMPSHI